MNDPTFTGTGVEFRIARQPSNLRTSSWLSTVVKRLRLDE